MPKFILIDHSIRDLGGHHYEYAVRVLDAARVAGLETALATNKSFDCPPGASHTIYPVFRHTFWENFLGHTAKEGVLARGLSQFHRWNKLIRMVKSRFVLNLYFSRFGLALLRLKHCQMPFNQFLRFSVGQVVPVRIPAYVYLALFLARTLWRAISTIATPIFRALERPLTWLYKTIICICVAPFSILSLCLSFIYQRSTPNSSDLFARDLVNLLREVSLEKGDHIFIPTLHDTELLGLIELFRRQPRARRLVWHLLFRRNIYHGRPPR